MKVSFLGADALQKGIAFVAKDLGIEVTDTAAELTVTVCEVQEQTLRVTRKGGTATITYGGGKARFFRALSTLCAWVRAGITERSVTESPIFTLNGAMGDSSRNAVMNVPTVKMMLRKMALMGMNMYMLYTEDTYELEGYPYFGYLRGRYTKAELKEMDAYAKELGIEMIPCIQTLGHLSAHLRWAAAGAYRDTSTVMLVGAEETYALIDKMMRTVKECFTTRRIHLGLDETADIGLGQYLKKNGYREGHEIYLEHLNKVCEMAHAHGLSPMMWSDMFFRFAGRKLSGYADYDLRVELTDEVTALVPKGVQQVFWDYYRPSEEFYAENLEKHEKHLGGKPMFAGGVWLFGGHCPQYTRSIRNSYPALEACRKKGIKEVMATIWLNGSEGTMLFALAGLAWYASYDYCGTRDDTDVRATFENACGVSYDDFIACELPEYPHGDKFHGVSRALIYNDPMTGLIDKHIAGVENVGDYYRDVTAKLRKAAENKGEFAPAFDLIVAFSDVLENKADFGVRLKAAYDAGDRGALAAMAEECDVTREKLITLKNKHRALWLTYNKPFGWEAHDIRYGGLISRFETAKLRIEAYLAGEIEAIEELAADRLRLDGLDESAEPFNGYFNWYRYETIATAALIN